MRKLNRTGEKGLKLIRDDRDRSQKIRMVVSDMDGSFLDGHGRVSPANAGAVRALGQAGIQFAVCTGRNQEAARKALCEAGITCGMVAMNGAAIYRGDGTLLREQVLSGDKAGEILKALMPWKDSLIIQLVTGDGSFIIAREQIFRSFFMTRIFPKADRSQEEEEALFRAYKRVTAEEFLKLRQVCYKIETLSEDTGLIREIRKPLESIEDISVAASFPTNWEITQAKATKDQGLKEYADSAGCALEEIMAVGDGDNDRAMLSLPLGWTVAMGNSGEDIKDVAKVITGTNQEDGFAQAVWALLEARDEKSNQGGNISETREGLVQRPGNLSDLSQKL